jgi:hypothetical protein
MASRTIEEGRIQRLNTLGQISPVEVALTARESKTAPPT